MYGSRTEDQLNGMSLDEEIGHIIIQLSILVEHIETPIIGQNKSETVKDLWEVISYVEHLRARSYRESK